MADEERRYQLVYDAGKRNVLNKIREHLLTERGR